MLLINGKIAAADIRGQQFGKLTAVAPTAIRQHSAVVWELICDCGGTAYAIISHLRQGRKRHCGCTPYYRKTNEEIVVELEETDTAAYAIAAQSDKVRQLTAALRRAEQMPR